MLVLYFKVVYFIDTVFSNGTVETKLAILYCAAFVIYDFGQSCYLNTRLIKGVV